MKLRSLFALLCLVVSGSGLGSAADYKGPRPPKPDVPYLLHAQTLVETESSEAREETKKSDTTYVIDGAESKAKTPLAEPIFILETQQLSAEGLELYRLTVRNGRREVSLSGKRRKGEPKPLHLLVTKLADRLYRVEADEHLEPGQYSLSPNGSNRVFCFEVF